MCEDALLSQTAHRLRGYLVTSVSSRSHELSNVYNRSIVETNDVFPSKIQWRKMLNPASYYFAKVLYDGLPRRAEIIKGHGHDMYR